MGHGSLLMTHCLLCSDPRGLALSERVVVTTWSVENLSWVDVQHLGGVAAGNGNKPTSVHLARYLQQTRCTEINNPPENSEVSETEIQIDIFPKQLWLFS